jgi:hypothetical protein
MANLRRGARSVLKYFAPLYVLLIAVQVFLAGEGIFRLHNISDSDHCNKSGIQCVANSKSLDAHRALGFILTTPGALLFLICALLAWHPNSRVRIVSIVVPFLTFLQTILAGIGGWVGGGLHPVNAFIVLGMFIWLTRTLRQEPGVAVAASPVPEPTG